MHKCNLLIYFFVLTQKSKLKSQGRSDIQPVSSFRPD